MVDTPAANVPPGGNTPVVDPAATPATPVANAAPETPVTPAAEPAVAAKPEDLSIAPDEKPKVEEAAEITFEPTGDSALDIALDFVAKFGIGPDHEAIVAAQAGDFTALEAALKANPDAKGYEKFLKLGKEGYDRIEKSVAEKSTAALADIHSAVGGKENWDTIRAWAKANAEPEEVPAVNAALNAGGVQAKAMAFYLGTLFNAADPSADPADPLRHDAAGGKVLTQTPLAPKEYVNELNALRRRIGGDFESSPEAQALAARALAYRNNN